jgi:hypothetical protein
LPPLEAIARLREQGAFISVSHPFDSTRGGSWHLTDLLEIAPLVDAIETFNARCLSPAFNRQAQAFASRHNRLATAGSDAHITWELGRAVQRLPWCDDPVSLRAALAQSSQEARLSPFFIQFSSRMARWTKALRAQKARAS